MKKVKFTGKLSLNKETIAKLNDEQMNTIKGGDANAGGGAGGNGRVSFITLCRSCIDHGSPNCGTCVSCVC